MKGWGGHVWFECKDCDNPYCNFCSGGLASCVNCNGFEGSLPSQCPGVEMTREQEDSIYAGDLDFRAGVWVNAPSGGVSSHWDGRPGLPTLDN